MTSLLVSTSLVIKTSDLPEMIHIMWSVSSGSQRYLNTHPFDPGLTSLWSGTVRSVHIYTYTLQTLMKDGSLHPYDQSTLSLFYTFSEWFVEEMGVLWFQVLFSVCSAFWIFSVFFFQLMEIVVCRTGSMVLQLSLSRRTTPWLPTAFPKPPPLPVEPCPVSSEISYITILSINLTPSHQQLKSMPNYVTSLNKS